MQIPVESPMRKYILGLLFALVMLTVLVSVFLFVRGGSQPTASSALQDLLTNEECSSACWLGIEPGVTSRETAQNILRDANIIFVDVPLPEPEKNAIYDFSQDKAQSAKGAIAISGDTVSQITLVLDVCISRIIADYGTPAEIQESGSYVSLLYPESGLVFNVSPNDPKRVVSIFLTSPAVFGLNFSGESLENDWEVYKDRFSGECSDDLASSVLAEYAPSPE
jgi:hypothetical protein